MHCTAPKINNNDIHFGMLSCLCAVYSFISNFAVDLQWEGEIRHSLEMRFHGYNGKLHSYLRTFAVEEKFILLLNSNLEGN